MKKNGERRSNADMRPQYDFTSMKGGVRGKYYERYRKGTNVVLLEPDVAEAFPTEGAVNEALRGVLGLSRAGRTVGRLPARTSKITPRKQQRRTARG